MASWEAEPVETERPVGEHPLDPFPSDDGYRDRTNVKSITPSSPAISLLRRELSIKQVGQTR